MSRPKKTHDEVTQIMIPLIQLMKSDQLFIQVPKPEGGSEVVEVTGLAAHDDGIKLIVHRKTES